jgi:hypothetical protein
MTTPTQINPPRNSRRQRGAAIIIMALILMLGLITLFTFRLDRRGPELEADRKTAMALAQAKEALLGRTASDAGATPTPGRLLCPDIANQGNSAGGIVAGNCFSPPGIPANAGRVPWKTLRLSDLGDGASERLWYVVAAEFINDSNPWNTTTIAAANPLITIVGNQAMNRVVAVLIAPGAPLPGQMRDTAANQNTLANYVESYVNGTTINAAAPSAAYNDRILTITAREVFSIATQRVVGDLANMSPPPYTLGIAGDPLLNLIKPTVWTDNNWDNAVDIPNSSVTVNTITLRFQNCAIVYTITGPGSVARSTQSC